MNNVKPEEGTEVVEKFMECGRCRKRGRWSQLSVIDGWLLDKRNKPYKKSTILWCSWCQREMRDEDKQINVHRMVVRAQKAS